jgi:hypothetical protein
MDCFYGECIKSEIYALLGLLYGTTSRAGRPALYFRLFVSEKNQTICTAALINSSNIIKLVRAGVITTFFVSFTTYLSYRIERLRKLSVCIQNAKQSCGQFYKGATSNLHVKYDLVHNVMHQIVTILVTYR